MPVRTTKYAAAGVCAMLLGACASTGEKGDIVGYGKGADYKDAVGVFTNPNADPASMDPIAAAAYWGTRFDREPQVADNAVRYSQALRKIGSTDEAVNVMTKAITRHPNDSAVNLEFGKTLVEEGRAFEAVRYIETAVDGGSKDWRALSAYGVALDQIGEHAAARQKYDEALRLAPDAVSVMNNKGLSYAMDGDLQTAVSTLRAATGSRRGDARVRQNLALVLAISGDMKEAERLARSDLPPQIADQNIAYFRQLMTQPAFWQDYAAGAADAPAFDPPSEPKAQAKPRAKTPAGPTPLTEEPKEEKKDPAKPVAQAKPVPVTNASATGEGSANGATPASAKKPAAKSTATPAAPAPAQSTTPTPDADDDSAAPMIKK